MKLKKLSSNNPKFKTLSFNRGLNVVAGLQLSAEDKKSINGIGKSMSLAMLHYLLGAEVDDRKITEFLRSYGDFYLEFSHNGIDHRIARNFSSGEFYLDEKSFKIKDYRKQLDQLFLPKSYPLSFRQVFNCFARRYGGFYYSDALTQQGLSKADYLQKYVNLHLLGFDVSLVEERNSIKDKISKLDQATDVIDQYERTLESSNLKDIEDEIDILLLKKKEFKISENYSNLKITADNLTNNLNELRNKKYTSERKLRVKMEILDESLDDPIDPNKIESIYNEAKFYFKSGVKKRLIEAQKFHTNLINNRRSKIAKEVADLRKELAIIDENILKISHDRDLILKDLDSSGALEEYHSLLARIQSLNEKKDELEKYKNILRDFKKERTELVTNNSLIRGKSLEYLEKSADAIKNVETLFRNFTKRFYENAGGSFDLIDTKDARYLYDIKIHVPREGSQGVGEVKIFCYDALLYSLNKNLLGFMAHDGCIFSEMDPRQEAMIIKIAIELVEKTNLQYFININENTLNEILEGTILTDNEKKILSESIILKLYDKNPENTLFGESFG